MVDVLSLVGLAVKWNKVVQINNHLRSNSIQGYLYIDICRQIVLYYCLYLRRILYFEWFATSVHVTRYRYHHTVCQDSFKTTVAFWKEGLNTVWIGFLFHKNVKKQMVLSIDSKDEIHLTRQLVEIEYIR
jgi:hypothetical protein